MSINVSPNDQGIVEFRANGGKVGGNFEGVPLLILHMKGAKTGASRVKPLVYLQHGDKLAVFASKAGAPAHPAWYHNIVANRDAEIEIGTETRRVRARLADPAERAEIWSAQKDANPAFAEYERKPTREIPVIILDRA